MTFPLCENSKYKPVPLRTAYFQSKHINKIHIIDYKVHQKCWTLTCGERYLLLGVKEQKQNLKFKKEIWGKIVQNKRPSFGIPKVA